MPVVAASTQTKTPAATPAAVARPVRRPDVTACRTTTAKSGPGDIAPRPIAAANAMICAAVMTRRYRYCPWSTGRRSTAVASPSRRA
jgi:hypothetical protein